MVKSRVSDVSEIAGPTRLAYFTPINEQPSLADRKAMFILAASGLMASVLLYFSNPLGALLNAGGATTAAASVALVCVGGLVLISAATAYRAYTRRLPTMPTTLAFYREVAEPSAEEYSHQMRTLDHPAALRAVLHYNYSVATLAASKFRLVNRSLKYLRVAIPLWMVLLLVLALWRSSYPQPINVDERGKGGAGESSFLPAARRA